MNALSHQLSLDLEAASRSRSMRSGMASATGSHTHAPRTKMTSVFHPEGSFISEDRFALKISNAGQAYLIQGSYHLRLERSFSDGGIYAAFVDRVNVDRIYLYRNGAYVFVPISKQVQDRLSHRALDILSDSKLNPNLSNRA